VIGRLSRGAAAIAVLAFALVAGGCGSSSSSTTENSDELPKSFFGMMTQDYPTQDDFVHMQDGNVGQYRAFFPWTNLEPSKGKYQFAGMDLLVSGAASHGIEVLPYLFASPQWVTDTDGADCGDQCPIYAPRSDETLRAWGEFVAATVERYGPGGEFWDQHPGLPQMPIHAWQIWNEQNSPAQYGPKPDVETYEKLLSVASEKIHDIDPDAEVVLGGMFGTPLGGEAPAITAPVFLTDLYRIEGDNPQFDAVAVHPYGAQTAKVIAQVKALHQVITDNGDDARLLVTEIGWSSGNNPSEPLERGPQGQAERLTESYNYLIDHRSEFNIQGVDWYSLSDRLHDPPCEWCGESGLLTEDGKPKPAWDAFTGFTGGS
jgi:hypothetical protein